MPMTFDCGDFTDERLKSFYVRLLEPRLIEEKMLVLLRQGKISKWFSGIGQEAISVGTAMALEPDEYILPMHRNLGVFTVRDVPLDTLFMQFEGRRDGFTHGRDRSFHFGSKAHRIVGMISHLGPQMGVADGIALAHRLRNEGRVTAVFTGDGATSEGDFHEAVNVAAVWDLPVLFIIESNGYGLSTPSAEQFRCRRLIDKAIGYGIEGIRVDGNDVLAVYRAVHDAAERMRVKPAPLLLECMTFRMRGHEEASGTKYVPKQLMEEWAQKDPVTTFERFLLDQHVLDAEAVEGTRHEIRQRIEAGLKAADEAAPAEADAEREAADVYAPFVAAGAPPAGARKDMRLVDAVSDGLRLALRRFPNLVLMGQDIAGYGGVFKVTEGFVDEFGKDRIRNTPLCESAIVGAGLGLSVNGYKSVIEMQFADFITCGFNQVVNNLAKVHYRWGQHADVVIRMPTGAGVGAGPFHSQSNEAWFFHTPGLKIAYPAFPMDAKGLLLAAVEDPNPVLFFEHKALYRSVRGDVPEDYYTLPFGKAARVRDGDDLTIVTYGYAVHWVLEALAKHDGIDAEVIDLRTLMPWDREAVARSVEKTGKVLVAHEDTLTGGIGAEIAAWIGEHCFSSLDAPVMRCGALDTPVPMAPRLEWDFLPKSRIEEAVVKLAGF